MILIDDKQRPIEGRGNFIVWGIAEDAGRRFVYLIDRQTGKNYIEEAVCNLNLENNLISADLRWIEDDQLHQALVKFFHDNVIFKNILDNNKRLLDKG